MTKETATMQALEDELLARDFLYDAPRVYRDAVRLAFEAIRNSLSLPTGARLQRV